MESVKYERGNYEITEITKILMSQPKTKRREKSPIIQLNKTDNAAQITLNCDIDQLSITFEYLMAPFFWLIIKNMPGGKIKEQKSCSRKAFAMGNTCLARAKQTQITLKSWGIMTKQNFRGMNGRKMGVKAQ